MRLRKGEIAPGIAMRSNRSKESVAARLHVFDELQRREVTVTDARWARFASVYTLASWEEADLCIFPVSPKTLRKHINLIFEGGYRAFMLALENMRNHNTPPTVRLSAEGALRQGLQREAAAILEMTNRYMDLMKRLRDLAENDPLAMAQIKHHLRIFGDVPPYLTRVK